MLVEISAVVTALMNAPKAADTLKLAGDAILLRLRAAREPELGGNRRRGPCADRHCVGDLDVPVGELLEPL